jgi:hypothetical protein
MGVRLLYYKGITKGVGALPHNAVECGNSDARKAEKRASQRAFSCTSASAEGKNGNIAFASEAYRVTSQLPFRRSNTDCTYQGWVGWGNLRANGHPHGGPWRQLLCIACRRYFLESLGTIFHGKRASGDLIVRVIACLAEGLGIRGTARVFEVDANTVLQWLVDAAEQLRTFSQHVLHDVRVRQVQLDELFALLSAVKDGKVSEAEAIEHLERSPH